MNSVGNNAALLDVAYWVAVLTLLLAFVLLAAIVLLRLYSQWRVEHDERARLHWSQVMQEVLAGKDVQVRHLRRGESPGFIEAWNAIHESLSGPDSRRLVPLGQRVGLAQAARRMLRGRHHHRAMAIVALGYLRDPDTFDDLARFLRDSSPIVSLCAAHALGNVNPSRGMAMFVPMILTREDWVSGSVARILSDNEDGSAARELGEVVLRANDGTKAKLVRFLAGIDAKRAARVIRELLDHPVDDHVTSVCLQLVNDKQDRERVARLLAASRWHVRMQAAAALGRIGDATDGHLLEPLLADEVWWVRYRAAQAMLSLPGVDVAAMRQVQRRQGDAFGRDIIDQVLAEDAMGVVA